MQTASNAGGRVRQRSMVYSTSALDSWPDSTLMTHWSPIV
jgi:hypothetical protein